MKNMYKNNSFESNSSSKAMKFIFIFILVIGTNQFCKKKYLDLRPLGEVDETSLANKEGVERLLIGAYSLLDGIGGNKSSFFSAASNWVYGSIAGGEAYIGGEDGDAPRRIVLPVEKFEITSFSEAVASKWGTVYDGIQRSNDVLRIMVKARNIQSSDMNRIAAEARFLRAHYHFEAKKIWNKVPFVDESITYGNGNYHVSNDRNIWPDIENDLMFAVSNLSENSYQGAPGRANKYTAMAILAKAYVFQKKFSEARPLLQKIIDSKKYELINFHDNFNPATTNSKESIFSAQMSVNDNSDGQNGNFGDALNFPHGGGPGGCCGYFQPSQYLVNHFITDPVSGLPDLDDFNSVDVTNDEGKESSDAFSPYAGPLDPRLDWTVGRRGIPYLDWGNHPGKNWIRRQDLGGPYSPKKNVFYKSQEGTLSDATSWAKGTSSNNVNLIRYADILLWAAEVEAEIGSPDVARYYVNLVRKRAADPAGWVKNPDGTPAANYKIGLYSDPWNQDFALRAIRFERMLELALEGHRFFDLVRWGIAESEINRYLQKEKKSRTYLEGVVFRKNCHEYFPIPVQQVDLSAGMNGIATLKQNPCH